MNTLYALSSGSGKSGVAVFRFTGSGCTQIAESFCGGLPKPRMASLKKFYKPNTQNLIDTGLVLYFPAPQSFTGEDCLEFQIHGSIAVIKAFVECFSQFPFLRAAQAGEFTRRAYLNGKMDLTEVEGLSDLLAAETEIQRQFAANHASGQLREKAEAWRTQLIRQMALVEATIDFSDEGDISTELATKIKSELQVLSDIWRAQLKTAKFSERVRDGFKVVLIGAPNAGKSSLFNAIAGRDVAIISSIAGTTRDSLEVHLDIHGLPITLIDTAGLRDTTDEIEIEGVRRAKLALDNADLVLHVQNPQSIQPIDNINFSALVLSVFTHGDQAPQNDFFTCSPLAGELLSECQAEAGVILNEVKDLDSSATPQNDNNPSRKGRGGINQLLISSKTGQGIDALLEAIYAQLADKTALQEPSLITRKRHAECFDQALYALEIALKLDMNSTPELVAEELRSAAHALARLSGKIDVEDLLDFIFREFCIGK